MKQPFITLGKVSSGGIGTQNVNIGGASESWKNVSSGILRNDGENVLVVMVNDDTPVIVGDGGYSVSG